MSKFRIGDKVRREAEAYSTSMRVGEVYTVCRIGTGLFQGEIFVEGNNLSWSADRFSLVVDETEPAGYVVCAEGYQSSMVTLDKAVSRAKDHAKNNIGRVYTIHPVVIGAAIKQVVLPRCEVGVTDISQG